MNYDLKIFTENIEPEAINQIYELIKLAPFENAGEIIQWGIVL